MPIHPLNNYITIQRELQFEKKQIENIESDFFPSSLTTWIPLYRVAYILSLGSSRAPQAAPRGTWLAVAFCRNTDTRTNYFSRVSSPPRKDEGRRKGERRDLSRSSRKNDLLLAGNETSGYLSSSECSAFTAVLFLLPFLFFFAPFSSSSPLPSFSFSP